MTSNTATRNFSRQADLVPMDKLATTEITVIGLGAVGRNVAVQLASMGATNLRLIDFDDVDASNVTTQGFLEHQIDMPKVTAVAASIDAIDPSITVVPIYDRWRPTQPIRGAVFCCVDSMAARKLIYTGLNDHIDFWCDGRMLGFNMSCYAIKDAYLDTLYTDDEVEPGRCTAKSTIFTACGLASAMLYQFVRFLRGEPTFNSIGFPGNFTAM